MKTKLRILFALFGVLSIGQGAFADVDTKSSSKPRRPVYREITPNAGPRVAYGADVFLTADFIWWKAKQAGLTYATTGALQNPSTAFESLGRGRDAQVSYNWDPGFKVGAGLNFWHDGWDVSSEYTWLHTDGSNSIQGAPGAIPSMDFPSAAISGGTPYESSSRSTLHFNTLDLELGRNFYVSQFLMLRPHFGFKGTWQNQDWRTRYFAGDYQLTLASNTHETLSGPYRVHQKSKYYGVGIRAGLDTAWHFTTNWSLFGDISWTAMWSRYRLKRQDTVDDKLTGEKQRNFNTRSNFYDIKYVGELHFGLRWETWFSDDNYHIQLQAGWEEQIWINHMTYIQVGTPAPYFDLTLHGLTVMLRFDF